MNRVKHIRRMQEMVIELLPDTCKIEYKVRGNIGLHGYYENDTILYRTWRGKEDIPCRPDLMRGLRMERPFYTETVIDEYNLEIPHDVYLLPSDIIIINGKRHEIRKVHDIGDWQAVKTLSIMEITS